MEYSSISKLGRQSLISARSKGRNTDIGRRGANQLAENGRRHEFSLDSLDKEIFQTMSRGPDHGHGSSQSDSASESSGSAQEKAICSRQSPHSEPVPHSYASPDFKRHPKTIMPAGLHSSESTAKMSKKPNDQHQGLSHSQTPPMRPEADARPNGYKQQVAVNANGGKHQQDTGHWHHPGGTLHHSGGNNQMHVSKVTDLSFQDAQHYGICNQDAEVSSSNSGEDNGEETRRKQASESPYSGSTGGRSHQRSALKPKVTKAPSSKWDDADKWIASPRLNESATPLSACSSEGSAPSPLLPGKRLRVAGQVVGGCNELDSTNVAAPREDSSFSQNKIGIKSTVDVKDHIQQIESAIQNSLVTNSPVSEILKKREASRASAKCVDVKPSSRSDPARKRGDTSIITSTMTIQRPKDCRLDDFISPPTLKPTLKPTVKMVPQVSKIPVPIPPTEKPPPAVTPTDAPVKGCGTPNDAPVKDIFSNGPHSKLVSDFPGSKAVRESGTETAQHSSLCKDMGTQMTPNPSVRFSRRETLGAFNTSPDRHNNTPDQSRRTSTFGASAKAAMLDLQNFQTEKSGRRVPISQPQPTLDRNLNWSTREEEEAESATCLRTRDCEETPTRPFVAWAYAWEEAERAKYIARYQQEEARIKAWEDLQKAKAEAKMRKTEAKLDKLHEIATQKMSHQIASVNRKAEDMRAAADASRDELAAKVRRRAEHIQHTGKAPPTLLRNRLVSVHSAPRADQPSTSTEEIRLLDAAFEKIRHVYTEQ